MSELIAIQGKAFAPHDGQKLGEEVIVVVQGRIKETADVDTSERGTDHVLKIAMKEATFAQPNEAKDFLERIAKAKAARVEAETGQGNMLDSDDDLPVGDDS